MHATLHTAIKQTQTKPRVAASFNIIYPEVLFSFRCMSSLVCIFLPFLPVFFIFIFCFLILRIAINHLMNKLIRVIDFTISISKVISYSDFQLISSKMYLANQLFFNSSIYTSYGSLYRIYTRCLYVDILFLPSLLFLSSFLKKTHITLRQRVLYTHTLQSLSVRSLSRWCSSVNSSL